MKRTAPPKKSKKPQDYPHRQFRPPLHVDAALVTASAATGLTISALVTLCVSRELPRIIKEKLQ